MDIQQELLKMHSKKNAVGIATAIGDDMKKIEELLQIYFANAERTTMRSSMVLSHIHDTRPYLIWAYLPQLIRHLRLPEVQNCVKRVTVRILQDSEIPEDLLGEAADICFGYVTNPAEAVAVRCFSMTVCWNICLRVPELMPELKAALEDWLDHGTAGFKSRGKKILAAIARYEREKKGG